MHASGKFNTIYNQENFFLIVFDNPVAGSDWLQCNFWRWDFENLYITENTSKFFLAQTR